MDGLELFHPERMASRILGMGDVLSLIEKAQQDVDQEKAKDLEQKCVILRSHWTISLNNWTKLKILAHLMTS